MIQKHFVNMREKRIFMIMLLFTEIEKTLKVLDWEKIENLLKEN